MTSIDDENYEKHLAQFVARASVIFNLFGFKWSMRNPIIGYDYAVPSAQDIETRTRGLVKDALNHLEQTGENSAFVSCGRITVNAFQEEGVRVPPDIDFSMELVTH